MSAVAVETPKFEDILNHLNVLGLMYYKLDVDNDVLTFSDNWYAHTGYFEKDMRTTAQFFDASHPDDRFRLQISTEKVLDGSARLLDEQFRFRLKDGSYDWFSTKGYLYQNNPQTDARTIVGYYNDISEQKKAEADLAQSNRILGQITASGTITTFEWHLDSDDFITTDDWVAFLGLNPDRPILTHETWLAVIHPDDRERVLESFRRLAREPGISHEVEYRICGVEGSCRWIVAKALISERSHDGRPKVMVGTVENVTTARQRTLEIAEANARVSKITQNIPGMVYEYRQTNQGEYSFPFVSDGLADLFDLKILDLDAAPAKIMSMYHAEDRDRVLAFIRNITAGDKDKQIEYRITTDAGETKWLNSVVWNATRNANGDLNWYGYINDITEIKQLEKRREEMNETLKRHNEDLEQLNYVLGHDLVQPARGIAQLVEWLSDDLVDNTNESVAKNLGRLQERAARLQDLVRDLAAFSRAGRHELESSLVSPQELVRQICHDLESKGINFDFENVSATPFETGRGALQTVLTNLLGNAVKYHDDPATGVVKISTVVDDDSIIFHVEDNGPGIAPKYHKKIFRMYSQLNPEVSEGTGSGLAIVKRVLNKVGGEISVESPLSDNGTRFTFSWPLEWKMVPENDNKK